MQLIQMATKGPQLGDGSATANPADANRRMSVAPAALNATQIVAQREQLNELLTERASKIPHMFSPPKTR